MQIALDRGIETAGSAGFTGRLSVRSWPNAVISEREIKRLPNVRFFAKKIFAPRNQFPIGALRNPIFYQMIRPD
jgi:hypothetical protein